MSDDVTGDASRVPGLFSDDAPETSRRTPRNGRSVEEDEHFHACMAQWFLDSSIERSRRVELYWKLRDRAPETFERVQRIIRDEHPAPAVEERRPLR